MQPHLTLYFFDASHACQCALQMLAHKGLAFTPRRVPPVIHVFAVRAKGFERNTVPALLVGRERVQGTRAISRKLDELQPEPPLFPPDPEQRRRVEDAERRGEEIQDAVRRVFYAAARRYPEVVTQTMGAKATRGLIIRAACWAHSATDEAARRDLAELPAMLDEVDGWLADGIIGGPQLNAADFQIASVLRPLPRFDDVAPYVEHRPAVRHAVRVAGEQPGHMPSVLPADWLAPLRASAASTPAQA